ncbi:MAG: hypothetical protein HUU57_17205 [Bdellovibrio sp.]|nr:hypothetical protein [Bdellovibrio sp.]
MKSSKTLDRITPDHPPKKPLKFFMKAEVGLLVAAIVVGMLAYIFTQGHI